MASSPLRVYPLRCVALLLFLLPSCSAQYDDSTVAIAVVVAIALLLIAAAAISIVVILVIHWWRQHRKQHIIRRRRRQAGQRRREIIAIANTASSACDSPPKPKSSTGKRVKWSDEDKVEACVPKARSTETTGASQGASDGKELVSIPVHTVDVPAPLPNDHAVEQQQTPSANEHKLDTQTVGKARDGEADDALPPEESDNVLDHEVEEASSNEEDSDNEPVSFL